MSVFRLVNSFGGRPWQIYAVPAAFLLAATVSIGLLRGQFHSSPAKPHAPHHGVTVQPARHRRSYVVRAGDTIDAISARTGVPQKRILSLNPKVSPTALFIGERLRLS
jgi:spore germination protein YaaH